MFPLFIATQDESLLTYAQTLCTRYGLCLSTTATEELHLVLDAQGLSLQQPQRSELGVLQIDFVGGRFGHRRMQQSKEAVVQAVLGRKKQAPKVWDMTAGLGRDSFLLAQAGCEVTMFERHPALAALLDDGLRRALSDEQTAAIAARMQICHADSGSYLASCSSRADVIYLDPMYPARDKQLKVKREMQWLKWLIGPAGDDASEIARLALAHCDKLVVKRPEYAPPLLAKAATSMVTTKSHRFECYVNALAS